MGCNAVGLSTTASKSCLHAALKNFPARQALPYLLFFHFLFLIDFLPQNRTFVLVDRCGLAVCADDLFDYGVMYEQL